MVYIALSIAGLVVASVQAAAYYYFQKSYPVASTSSDPCTNSGISKPASLIAVNALINYGNGTMRWYNETIPTGWNTYQLTLHLTNCHVQADYYGPPLSEHLVHAINGVANSGSFSWWLWTFCQTRDAWVSSGVGADQVQLSNGQTIAWAYAKSTLQPPILGTKTAGSC